MHGLSEAVSQDTSAIADFSREEVFRKTLTGCGAAVGVGLIMVKSLQRERVIRFAGMTNRIGRIAGANRAHNYSDLIVRKKVHI